MRNVKFVGYLVRLNDYHGRQYVRAILDNRAGDADWHRVKLMRLRNVLEFRYLTIV